MATSLADDAKNADWREPLTIAEPRPFLTRAEGLWTLFGLALLGTFLSFVLATT
jgi:hypothetical protein